MSESKAYSPERVSFKLIDNNEHMVITLDGKSTSLGLEIYFTEDKGYFFADSFSQQAAEVCGQSRLNEIKQEALAFLNK